MAVSISSIANACTDVQCLSTWLFSNISWKLLRGKTWHRNRFSHNTGAVLIEGATDGSEVNTENPFKGLVDTNRGLVLTGSVYLLMATWNPRNSPL